MAMNAKEKQVIHWLAHGEVGFSSKAMAMWLAFDTVPREPHCHPHDPSDFDRCLKLLDAAPWLRENLHKMARLGHEWAALVSRWDEIEASHLDEVGLGWTKARSAPKTYALMREIIDGAYTRTS